MQLDGSHHAWLEDRGPKFALLLAVDDATGAVANAVFGTGEDTRGYFMLLEGLIERWGIPVVPYSDRHAVFEHNPRQPETAAEATQCIRSLQELGIRQPSPASPRSRSTRKPPTARYPRTRACPTSSASASSAPRTPARWVGTTR